MSPRMIGLHIVALVATTAAVWLGLWQYDAWQTRREVQAIDLADAKPQPLVEVMGPDDPFPGDAVGRPVELTGVWLSGESFVVSGRENAGTEGFWAITPVAVCTPQCDEANPAMVVVLGWTDTPEAMPEAPSGPVSLTGWLQPPEGSGTQDPDHTDDVLPELRTADMIQRVDQDLYGAYLIADEVSTGGQGTGGEATGTETLRPVTPASLPEPETFTALRNLLYALEWWVFAAFAVFIWWHWCRDEIEQAKVPSTVGAGDFPNADDEAATNDETEQALR